MELAVAAKQYEQIAERLRTLVVGGTLQPGARLCGSSPLNGRWL